MTQVDQMIHVDINDASELENKYPPKHVEPKWVRMDISLMVAQNIPIIAGLHQSVHPSEAEKPIALSQVNSREMAWIVEYILHYNGKLPTVEQFHDNPHIVDPWEKEFVNKSESDLHGLMLAAKYLEIDSIIHTCCRADATKHMDKTDDEIRKIYHLAADHPFPADPQLDKKTEPSGADQNNNDDDDDDDIEDDTGEDEEGE